MITKVCEFEFIGVQEHVFMIATNKWIISSPKLFSTSVQCDTIFTSINLKTTTIVEVPEGCSMHLRTHTIWPGSYLEETELEIKHYNWIWENIDMFPNYNDNAIQTTLNILNKSSIITIDYINKEVKLRKDIIELNKIKTKQLISEIKNTEDIHVHPNIIFYAFLVSFVVIFGLYYKFICPMAPKQILNPLSNNEIELDIVRKPDSSKNTIYPSINTINA
jgi:hypothetical protein